MEIPSLKIVDGHENHVHKKIVLCFIPMIFQMLKQYKEDTSVGAIGTEKSILDDHIQQVSLLVML